MAMAYAAGDQDSGHDPGPTVQMRKLFIEDHPGPNAMPHDTRRWLKAAQAELGELLAVAEGGDSMAAEEFGYHFRLPEIKEKRKREKKERRGFRVIGIGHSIIYTP